MINYDLIVIGSGPGGYPAAAAAARNGLKVLVAERREPGGTCLNRGCIPTKCLCRTAEVAFTAAESQTFGVITPQPEIDFAVAAQRKDRVVEDLRNGVTQILAGVDLIKGEACFVKPEVVEINGEEYSAPKIIVASGAVPARLPIPGAELCLTSDEILNATSLPASLAIIGGGVIGLEFASIYAALGVKVSVIEFCPEILPNMDAEVAKRLRMALRKRGISFSLSAAVTAVRPGFVVEFEQKGKPLSLEAEAVLMAVGRRPVLPRGLEEIGVEVSRRGIVVNPETMETSVKGVFAVGDVNGICQLAHAATAQGLRVVGDSNAPLDPIPAAVFTIPEMAAVGLTEAQCVGRNIKIGKATFRANGKALALGETDGMIKTVIDADSGKLLGATIMGPHAADLIHELTLAIATGLTVTQVADAIHAHPTLSEALIPALT